MPTVFEKIEWRTATPQQVLAAFTKETKKMTIAEYRLLGISSWANIRGLELEANMGILNNITIRKCM
jgi:hypothetical protein